MIKNNKTHHHKRTLEHLLKRLKRYLKKLKHRLKRIICCFLGHEKILHNGKPVCKRCHRYLV